MASYWYPRELPASGARDARVAFEEIVRNFEQIENGSKIMLGFSQTSLLARCTPYSPVSWLSRTPHDFRDALVLN